MGNRYRRPTVVASDVDHDGIDVLATTDGRSVSALLVNRTGRSVELDIDFVSLERSNSEEWFSMISRFEPVFGSSVSGPAIPLPLDGDGAGHLTATLDPQGLLGVEFWWEAPAMETP